MNQLVLPIDLEVKIQEDDIVFVINDLVESIPEEAFENFLLRSHCTKAKEGNNRRLLINKKWEEQKEYIRTKLSEEETVNIYKKRKIDVEPVFGFLKANLSFTRFSVRGKSKVENELAFALMAVNLRKYTAKIQNKNNPNNPKQKRNCGNNILMLFPQFFSFKTSFVPASFITIRTGLEPATSSVTGWHSNQLNYRTFGCGGKI